MINLLNSSEYDECVLLADYLALLQKQGKVIVYSHTAQSTFTKSWTVKRKNKALGVCSGVPDYLVVTPNCVFAIEMKKKKGGQTSETQKIWIEALDGKTVRAKVCRGYEEAKQFIKS